MEFTALQHMAVKETLVVWSAAKSCVSLVYLTWKILEAFECLPLF